MRDDWGVTGIIVGNRSKVKAPETQKNNTLDTAMHIETMAETKNVYKLSRTFTFNKFKTPTIPVAAHV